MPAQAPRRRLGVLPVAAVTVVAVAAAIGLILAGRGEPQRAETRVPTSGNVKGYPDAPVTVEEWADFQCPACRMFAEAVERRLEEDLLARRKAKLVYRNMAFLGPESVWAAEAARCAGDQGRFWEYHDKLFAEQAGENRGTFSSDNLKRFASELGLDTGSFGGCLDSGKYREEVLSEVEEGRAQGVSSTPTLFVNGRKLEGVARYDELREIIESAAGEGR
jgi:protein-disulfide isomerase